MLFSLVAFLRFQFFFVVPDLFLGLVEVVRSRGRSAPELLLVGYLIEVGVLAETEVELVKVAPLLVVALVKGVLGRVVHWGGQAFHHLYMIVHVESSFSHIVHVFATLLGFAILSLGDNFARIEILFHWLILCIIPRNVAVGVVEVHGSGWDDDFRVVHD